MNWFLNAIPWWAYLIAAIAAVVTVERLFGWKAALGVAVAALAAVAYRKGSDDRAKSVTTEVKTRQDKSQEKINAEERGARDAGRAAADRVRQSQPRAPGRSDQGSG